jgi:hypothetical protein
MLFIESFLSNGWMSFLSVYFTLMFLLLCLLPSGEWTAPVCGVTDGYGPPALYSELLELMEILCELLEDPFASVS